MQSVHGYSHRIPTPEARIPSGAIEKLNETITKGTEEEVNELLKSLGSLDLNSDNRAQEQKKDCLSNALYTASVNGHMESVLILLENNASPLRQLEEHGYKKFILHDTIKKGHYDCAMLLIQTLSADEAKDFVNQRDGSHNYPLYYAFSAGNLDLMQFLIRYGADLRVAFPNVPEKNLMRAAAGLGHLDITKFFITRGVDPKEKFPDGLTALDQARISGQKEVIEYLQKEGVPTDDTAVVRERSKLAFDILVSSFSPRFSNFSVLCGFSSPDECIAALLPEDVNRREEYSEMTLLHYLASHAAECSYDISKYVSQLLEKGADREIKDSLGRTPAAIAGSLSVSPCSDTEKRQHQQIMSIIRNPKEQEALLQNPQLAFTVEVSRIITQEIRGSYRREKFLEELKKYGLSLQYDKTMQMTLAQKILEGSNIEQILPGSLSHLPKEDLVQLSEKIRDGGVEIGFITNASGQREAVCLNFYMDVQFIIESKKIRKTKYIFKNVSNLNVFETWLKDNPKSIKTLGEQVRVVDKTAVCPSFFEGQHRIAIECISWDSDPEKECEKLLKERIGRLTTTFTIEKHDARRYTESSSFLKKPLITPEGIVITDCYSAKLYLSPQTPIDQNHFPHFSLQKEADGSVCVTEYDLSTFYR